MSSPNCTGTNLRFRKPDGSIGELLPDGPALTADNVNSDMQGIEFIVNEDAHAAARPIACDQYFSCPVFDDEGLVVALRDTDGRLMRVETHVGFWGLERMRFDVIVTRHAPLVEYLESEGWISGPRPPVLEHVRVSDVRGKHVLGVLPLRLAQEARSVTEVPIESTIEDRKAMASGDLTVERLREIAGKPTRYVTRTA